jgi:hypothetical protein
VSQGSLPEQIRRAFASLTRPPRPQLIERIRDSLWERPSSAAAAPASRSRPRLPVPVPTPAPSARPPLGLLAVVAGVLAVALVAGLLLFTGFGGQVARLPGLVKLPAVAGTPGPAGTPALPRTSGPSATPSLTPSPVPTDTPTPMPAPAPTDTPPPPTPAPAPAAPPVAPLPGYGCSTQSGGSGGQAAMTTARVGAQGGYDRFVIQFSGGSVPAFEVRPQDGATFGGVTLQGSAGLVVTLSNASGGGSYSGFTDFRPGFAEVREAKLLTDSQGTVQWGIGLAHATCFRAWTLGGPSRLVIDIQQ